MKINSNIKQSQKCTKTNLKSRNILNENLITITIKNQKAMSNSQMTRSTNLSPPDDARIKQGCQHPRGVSQAVPAAAQERFPAFELMRAGFGRPSGTSVGFSTFTRTRAPSGGSSAINYPYPLAARRPRFWRENGRKEGWGTEEVANEYNFFGISTLRLLTWVGGRDLAIDDDPR